MYASLYLDGLHIHTAIVRRINMFGFLYLDVLHVHTIVRITNICMPSFI